MKPAYHWLSARVCVSPTFEYRDSLDGTVKIGAAFIDYSGPIALREFESMLASGFDVNDPDNTDWLQ